jgi:hypothetical protein
VLYGPDALPGRRVIALWKHLPADAAIHVTRDPGGAYPTRWTTEAHLLAALSEQVDVLSSITYAAHAGKRARRWKPLRHQRPDLPLSERPKPAHKRTANAAETLAILRGEL